MLDIQYTPKGTPFVWASNLHKVLEIDTPLRKWFPRMIDYGFVLNQDYSEHEGLVPTANGGTTIQKDWAVQFDMAKSIAMLQKSEMGKQIRQYLLMLDKKVQDGAYLTQPQLRALFDLVKVLGFFTVQKELERDHFEVLDKPNDWWEYRAKLLGFDTKQLKAQANALGFKYKSQRQALFKIDKYELIRMAIVGLLISMGKTEVYAKNVARFAKDIAKEIKPEIYDDTKMPLDFKSEEQISTIGKIQGRKENPALLSNF